MVKRPTTKIVKTKVSFPLSLSIEFHKEIGIAAARAEQSKHKYIITAIKNRMRKETNEKAN